MTGLIEGIESTGSMTWLEVAVGATLLIISHSGRLSIGKGISIDLYIAPADVHLFDRDSDKAI